MSAHRTPRTPVLAGVAALMALTVMSSSQPLAREPAATAASEVGPAALLTPAVLPTTTTTTAGGWTEEMVGPPPIGDVLADIDVEALGRTGSGSGTGVASAQGHGGRSPGTGAPTPPTGPVAPIPSGTTGPAGPPGVWSQVFGDEFSGATLDPARWRANRYGGASSDGAFNPEVEGAFFTPRGVSVASGEARLTVQPEVATVAGTTYTHSSGTLSSEGRFALQDGDYVEARVYVPSGEGLWPAFWTVPSNRWPPETDVFEFFDSGGQSRPMFNHHYASGGQVGPRTYGQPGVDYRDSWHVFGLLRSHGALVPYVDGVPYPGAGAPAGADDLGHFLILNLSTYAGSAPSPGVAMRIDWVRAWRPA